MEYIKYSRLLSYKYIKKGLIPYLFISITPFYSLCQNLVPNGSFNDINDCNVSNWSSSVQSVEFWYAGIQTPDFFNYCFNSGYQVPNMFVGFSHPLSGAGLAGLGLFINNNNGAVNRETISVELSTTLDKNSFYCITFFYKNSQSDDLVYSTEMLSGMFTSDTITIVEIENPAIQLHNQVDEVYNGWRKFKSYYQPQGGETTFSIGYFGTLDYQHELINDPTHYLYYFIDSILVEECDKDSTLGVVLELPNVYTPNHDGINDIYRVKTNNLISLEVVVLNRWGNIVHQFDGLTQGWNGTNQRGTPCADGVYFVKAIGETKDGEILDKHAFIHLLSSP